MAQRIDNECAYCAEVTMSENGIVGKDWKVYCSSQCAAAGELISQEEWERLMRVAVQSRDRISDQIL